MGVWILYWVEIKFRLFFLFVTWFFTAAAVLAYKEMILFAVISVSTFEHYYELKPYFIFTDVTEIFTIYVKLIFFITNQICLIKIFYHCLVFLSSGLYKFEYRNLKFSFRTLVVAWLCSVVFLHKILIPLSWSFFLSYQEQKSSITLSLFFEAKLSEYFAYYMNLYFICVLNSQIFVCITFGISFVSKDVKKLKKFRRFFYYFFLVFSTAITPPDIFSQFFLSLIFIVMYEIAVIFKLYKQVFKQATS